MSADTAFTPRSLTASEYVRELFEPGDNAAVLVVPTGMVAVLDGSIDDGYQGLLGWIWLLSAASRASLRRSCCCSSLFSLRLLFQILMGSATANRVVA